MLLLPAKVTAADANDTCRLLTQALKSEADATIVVDDNHRGGDGVERHRPLATRLGQLLVQPRVDDRDGNVVSEPLQDTRVRLFEVRAAIEDRQRADDAARGRQGNDERVTHADQPHRLPTDVRVVRHVVHDDRLLIDDRSAADASAHGQHDAGQYIADATGRNDVEIVIPAERDGRAFHAKQRHRVAHDEAHDLTHPK